MLTTETIIDNLKEIYKGNRNRLQFDFDASMYLSGDHNKELRRSIIEHITGERRPLSKCGFYATTDVLKNSFNQLQIKF